MNIPAEKKLHYLQTEVGHYGVFNGSRFRNEIAPRMRNFIAAIDAGPATPRSAETQRAKPAPIELTGRKTYDDRAALSRQASGNAPSATAPPCEEFSTKRCRAARGLAGSLRL